MAYGDDRRNPRSVIVTLFLAAGVTAAVLGLMFLACGGLSVYAFAVVGGVGLVGLLHYLWWGQSLNREVAGEREEEEIRRRMEMEADPGSPGDGPWSGYG